MKFARYLCLYHTWRAPRIDPANCLKMLMISFFENLPSERTIASLVYSLSLLAFLKLPD